MADYVIPPRTAIVRCKSCKTLYVPDRTKDRKWSSDKTFASFEKCPVCGNDDNKWTNTIPLWMYNLIRWRRGSKAYEQSDDSSPDD